MGRTKPKKKVKKRGLAFQRLVGEIAKAFDPDSIIHVEDWHEGPDGRRDMDVVIEGTLNGKNIKTVIECKDYDKVKTGNVGIEIVDALDSKRHDLDCDFAVICSNSGFTKPAISKGKRKNIGLISILKANDPNAKAIITEEIFTRHISVKNIKYTIHGEEISAEKSDEIAFGNLPVINWVMRRIAQIVTFNSVGANGLKATHKFVKPLEFSGPIGSGVITGIDIFFSFSTKWFSQIVTLDASLGIFDYIRGKVQLGPGENQYMLHGLDIYGGEEIDYTPEITNHSIGLLPGEADLNLMLVDGIELKPENEIPDLDEHIVPEDLELPIPEKSSN